MYDTIIFDLDGTLMDTLYDLFLSTNYALRKHNLPERTYEEIKQFVGNGIKVLIEKAIGENHQDKLEEVLNDFTKHYEIHKMDNTKPYPNIIDLLKKLKDLNYKMAIVSNKYNEAVQEICYPLFHEYMTLYLGETSKLKRKPAPDMVFEAIKKLNSKTENCLFVGDSETDILTANNAHMDVCGVDWGFRGIEKLKKLKVNYLIKNPMDLLDILNKRG